ncbi:hypothetical protein UY3_09158 [Chelonia mydas]|uniref:Uncharacterized protein n=1 Tax=Chelonia mydas TaxID=8469 RepID=M7B974_CHEMY|nr:hypothetical protein UY3_09158 [Chelonia mydas]
MNRGQWELRSAKSADTAGDWNYNLSSTRLAKQGTNEEPYFPPPLHGYTQLTKEGAEVTKEEVLVQQSASS